jgi:hypothetical protein
MFMTSRPLVVVFAFLGCQSGEVALEQRPPAAKTVEPPTATPVASTVTPMQMIATEPMPTHEAAPPWTLTASDGSGLQLTRVDAKAVVQGPLALTELHLYFHNPEHRTREGTFAITLPSGAAVSRFAMENAGQWQEAEVVEKAVARRAYDDFLHRKQDPALLEKAAGNQFSARVFPIPADADKHLVLSFSQELAGRGYTLPLRGLPKVERVDVELAATHLDGSNQRQTLNERNWQPDHDFVATVPASAAAVTSGPFVVGALAFADTTATFGAPDAPKHVTLLVDTSASRALGFASYVASIHGLIDALRKQYGDPIELRVIAFDQDSQPIFDGVAADYGDAQDKALIARGAAGASNLAQAIATLAASPTPARRVVVVTDGVMTAGPDTPALVAAIKKLPLDRLDVVLAGGIRDERLAASIVRAGLPHAGDVFDLDRGIQAVASGLGQPVMVDVAIEVPGATWVYPRRIPAARPGSTLMVYARMAKPTRTIDVVIGGRSRSIGLGVATPALVERAVAAAEIEELESSLDGALDPMGAKAVRDDIAKRSVRARVISSQTSMLVLESDADYARYKIDRTALADILVIGPNGIEQTHRQTIVAAKSPRPSHQPPADPSHANDLAVEDRREAPSVDDAFKGDISSGFDDRNVSGGLIGNEVGEREGGFGYGRAGVGPGGGGTGWGTIGTGYYGTLGHGTGTGTGYGVGGGRGGLRGRTAAAPTVAIGQPSVQGDLDRVIIRRYIRRNIQKITYCYEKQLIGNPTLAGTVAVRFVIGPTGAVADVTATGLDDTVAGCVANAIKDIEFPRAVGGGAVQVNYPFTFRTQGSTAAEAPVDAAPAHPVGPETAAAAREPTDDDERRGGPPLTGKLATVMAALHGGSIDKAMTVARTWHDEAPGDVLALIAFGEALEAKHDRVMAARIYGSIIDLYSTRADFRRFAGERLERLGAPVRSLVIDTYRKAVADRPDHVTGHRLLAYALVRDADYAGAFAAILAGIDQKYPEGRFAGAERVLADDAGMIAAAYLAHGGKRDDITKQLAKRSLAVADHPSTRFIMYWETDANDVDFHIRDSHGGHAWYEDKQLPSGGELYADITTGYGPECFAIDGTPKAGPYKLSINYFSQGPMGYGMGLLQVEKFDGKSFVFDDRPYVIMTDQAFVDLGTY